MQKKTRKKTFPFFTPIRSLSVFRDNQIGPIQIFENILRHFQKKIGAEILINTKVIKVLLTGGVNPI